MRTLVLSKTIVFNGDGKLLTLRRSDDSHHRPGGFDLPGGKLDEGESVLEGALREAEEESGLHLSADNMQLVFADNHVGRRGSDEEDLNIIWIGYVTKLVDDTLIQLSAEHKQYAWQTLEEALAQCDSPTQTLFLTHLRDHDIISELWP